MSRPSRVWQRCALGMGAAFMLLAGCQRGNDTYRAGTELEAYTDEYQFGTGFIRPGTVLLYTAGQYLVNDDVTVESVELLNRSPGMEVRAARVAFIESKHRPATSPAGAYCVHWPIKDFGPSYEPANLRLRKGEAISVNLYVAAGETLGESTSSGVRLRYRTKGGGRRELADSSSEIEMQVSTTEQPQCAPGPGKFAGT